LENVFGMFRVRQLNPDRPSDLLVGALSPSRLDHSEVFTTLFPNLDTWAAVTEWVGAPAKDANNV
jgi:hypothetical protein